MYQDMQWNALEVLQAPQRVHGVALVGVQQCKFYR